MDANFNNGVSNGKQVCRGGQGENACNILAHRSAADLERSHAHVMMQRATRTTSSLGQHKQQRETF